MRFSVIDNGVGMNENQIEALRERIRDEGSQNIGLTNVNRRLLLQYGEESELKILSREGWGTCICFKIKKRLTDRKK